MLRKKTSPLDTNRGISCVTVPPGTRYRGALVRAAQLASAAHSGRRGLSKRFHLSAERKMTNRKVHVLNDDEARPFRMHWPALLDLGFARMYTLESFVST